MNTYNTTVCGLDITFRSSAESARVEQAVNFIQESYLSLQSHGSQVSRDRILAILAIGLADDLFELQKEKSEKDKGNEENNLEEKNLEKRLQKMLDSINSIIPLNN